LRRIDVCSAAELAAALEEEFPPSQVLLMAAAPADFRPEAPAGNKIKRKGSGLDLHLEPTEDILARLTSERREGQTIVGFAAEHGVGGPGRARDKLVRKGADLIVLNDVSDPEIGFESERNAVTLIDAETENELAVDSKHAIADAILDRVDELRDRARQSAER